LSLSNCHFHSKEVIPSFAISPSDVLAILEYLISISSTMAFRPATFLAAVSASTFSA